MKRNHPTHGPTPRHPLPQRTRPQPAPPVRYPLRLAA